MAKYDTYFLFDGFGQVVEIGTLTQIANKLNKPRKTLSNAWFQSKPMDGHLYLLTEREIKEINSFKAIYLFLKYKDQRWYCKQTKTIHQYKKDCLEPIKLNTIKEFYE
jgi:hypothetical protein